MTTHNEHLPELTQTTGAVSVTVEHRTSRAGTNTWLEITATAADGSRHIFAIHPAKGTTAYMLAAQVEAHAAAACDQVMGQEIGR